VAYATQELKKTATRTQQHVGWLLELVRGEPDCEKVPKIDPSTARWINSLGAVRKLMRQGSGFRVDCIIGLCT